MVWSPRSLTGLTVIVFSLLLSPGWPAHSTSRLGDRAVSIADPPTAMAQTKAYPQSDILR
ncbi:MAG: hypothetical protein AB4062_11960 [Crocosphaera sp.]